MRRVRAEQFDFYFETSVEADNYFNAMAEGGTWGDELTLRAATDLFNIQLHVLTSDESNYYHQYTAAPEVSEWNVATLTGLDAETAKKNKELVDGIVADRKEAVDVFVAYISPIHYNSIVIR